MYKKITERDGVGYNIFVLTYKCPRMFCRFKQLFIIILSAHWQQYPLKSLPEPFQTHESQLKKDLLVF